MFHKTEHIKRVVYLDVIHAAAVILIVFVHAWVQLAISPAIIDSEKGWINTAEGWIIWQIVIFPARCGVPLFAMLTGALMLGWDYSDIPAFLKRKLPKFMGATFVAACLYSILVGYLWGGVTLIGTLTPILQGDPFGAYHLWYMYMLVGLYISIPLLPKMLVALSERDVISIIICSLLLVIILITLRSDKFGFFYFNSYSFIIQTYTLYALLGYWLHNYNGLKGIDIRLRVLLYFLLWAGVVGIEFHKLFLKVPSAHMGDILTNDSIWAVASSVLLFSIIRDWFANTEKINGFIRLIAMSAFSIYLWHLIPVHLVNYAYLSLGAFNPFISVAINWLGGVGVGIVIYLALRYTRFSWLVK